MTDEKLNHAAMNLVGELQLTKPENYYEVARQLMQKYAASEIEALQKEVEKKQTVNEILRVEIERKDQKHLEDIRACHSQLTSIRARVAELEKDKERLDWLAKTTNGVSFDFNSKKPIVSQGAAFPQFSENDLRQAIDTAMSAEKK